MGSYIAGISPVEANLMSRVQAREEGAFGELFATFRPRILRTAMRILKEPHSAEDALQETLLNIYRAADRFRGDSKISTWINRITVNVCLETIRKNRKHCQRADEDISEDTRLMDDSSPSPFEKTHQYEVRSRVRNALGRLGEKHQVVVRMHDLEGFTIREIAERLDVAEGTIKSRLFYGREELKRQLAN